jgi:hypothetical protein
VGSLVFVSDAERAIVAHLGLTGWLTTTQVSRLGLPMARASELLNGLARPGGPRLVTRLTYEVAGRTRFSAWALTDPGHRLAQQVIGRKLAERPRDRTGSFLLKCTRVNEVYLALSEEEPRDANRLLSVSTRFRWQTAPGDFRFVADPGWSRLRPAAVVLFIPQRLRIFIEDEGDGVVPDEDRELRRIRLRLQRYQKFFHRHLLHQTETPEGYKYEWFALSQTVFHDAFPAALLFLAPSRERRDKLEGILGKRGDVLFASLVWQLRDHPGAVALLRHWLGLTLPGDRGHHFHLHGLRLHFFNENAVDCL